MIKNRPSLNRIRGAANVYFGFDVGVKSRRRELVMPRQITHYVAHIIYGHSQASTGLLIGKKDHATVFHSSKVVSSEMIIYPEIRDHVRKLIAKCKIKETIERTPDEIIFDLLKYSNASPAIKVELRQTLKLMKDEGN